MKEKKNYIHIKRSKEIMDVTKEHNMQVEGNWRL